MENITTKEKLLEKLKKYNIFENDIDLNNSQIKNNTFEKCLILIDQLENKRSKIDENEIYQILIQESLILPMPIDEFNRRFAEGIKLS